MATISETELRQKTSEYILFVREFMVNSDKDFVLKDKRDGFELSVFDKDVTLSFEL
jgi:hypothetical protein